MITVNVKKCPPLALFAFGVIAGAALIALMLVPNLLAANKQLAKHYGNALAHMAAQQATDASFNHDLVRLQVILQDVVENPNTITAAIYDAENALLVQAGDAKAATQHNQTFSAPIILHESIAGYLSVSLQKPTDTTQSSNLFIYLVIATCLAIAAWALYASDTIRMASAEKEQTGRSKEPPSNLVAPQSNQAYQENGSTYDEHHIDVNTEMDIVTLRHAHTTITIENLAQLKQQLSPTTLNHTLAKCEALFHDVMALYGGVNISPTDSGFCLVFPGIKEDLREARFRAICSAYLIVELTKNLTRIPLSLSAYIHGEDEEAIFEPLGVDRVYISDGTVDVDLQSRIDLSRVEGSNRKSYVLNFKQPYHDLLNNQLNQLLKMH